MSRIRTAININTGEETIIYAKGFWSLEEFEEVKKDIKSEMTDGSNSEQK